MPLAVVIWEWGILSEHWKTNLYCCQSIYTLKRKTLLKGPLLCLPLEIFQEAISHSHLPVSGFVLSDSYCMCIPYMPKPLLLLIWITNLRVVGVPPVVELSAPWSLLSSACFQQLVKTAVSVGFPITVCHPRDFKVEGFSYCFCFIKTGFFVVLYLLYYCKLPRGSHFASIRRDSKCN